MHAELYYVTNRRHRGNSQWAPDSYGNEPSCSGTENLRFGRVLLPYDRDDVLPHLGSDSGFGKGNGGSLAKYLAGQARKARIRAFKETLEANKNDATQDKSRFGSTAALKGLQEAMDQGCDILIVVHGFSVDWWDAVASALSLEFMLNRVRGKPVRVVLFTWPSDGTKIPWVVLLFGSERCQGECGRGRSGVSQTARLPDRGPHSKSSGATDPV